MKITILTLGTRGDVQPYVALATELISRDHEVHICTGESFQTFCESNGLTYHHASLDFMNILKTEMGQAIFNGGKMNLFKVLQYAKDVINPLYRQTMDDFYHASLGADLIIYHPKALVAADIAQALNIPCVNMPPVPMTYPTSEFANLAITTKNLGPTLNRLTYKATAYGESNYMKMINEFRQSTLKLSKRKTAALATEIDGKHIPTLYPISRHLFEDVKSWDTDHLVVPGFFYLQQKEDKLDTSIEAFLEKGDAPIVVSFSSMPLKSPERFMSLLQAALEKTNQRAILLTGANSITSTSERILTVHAAPHRLLFPKAKGIIHHGGVGTTAEALRSGVPQLIMPFSVDQPFWAKRLHEQGLALAPLKEDALTADALAMAITQFDDETRRQTAQLISTKLQAENGLAVAADFIETLIN